MLDMLDSFSTSIAVVCEEVVLSGSIKKPCAIILLFSASTCVRFSKISYPDCHSFPGKPLNVDVSSHLLNETPIVQVVWNPPNNG